MGKGYSQGISLENSRSQESSLAFCLWTWTSMLKRKLKGINFLFFYFSDIGFPWDWFSFVKDGFGWALASVAIYVSFTKLNLSIFYRGEIEKSFLFLHSSKTWLATKPGFYQQIRQLADCKFILWFVGKRPQTRLEQTRQLAGCNPGKQTPGFPLGFI